MKATALVMAGGKGTRMGVSEEKPLLQVGGRPVIDHVLAALKKAGKARSIVVAISDHTPKTCQHLAGLSVTVVKTPGKEYVSDMRYAIKKLKLDTVLALGADLPLITGSVIDEIIENYSKCGKPALSVVVPIEARTRLGLGADYVFKFHDRWVVPAGINMIDGRKIDCEELEEAICLMDKKEVVVNINTPQELRKAQSLFESQNFK